MRKKFTDRQTVTNKPLAMGEILQVLPKKRFFNKTRRTARAMFDNKNAAQNLARMNTGSPVDVRRKVLAVVFRFCLISHKLTSQEMCDLQTNE